jgi:hypothetical protein
VCPSGYFSGKNKCNKPVEAAKKLSNSSIKLTPDNFKKPFTTVEGFCFTLFFYVDFYVENIIGYIIKIIAAFLCFGVSCCKGRLPPFFRSLKNYRFIIFIR